MYLRAIGRPTPLTDLTQGGTAVIHDDRPQVREDIALANRGLVAAIAERYVGRGLEPTELIHAGSIGLGYAVAAFDPDHGAPFSTFASWWIKQAIKRALLVASRPAYIPGRCE